MSTGATALPARTDVVVVGAGPTGLALACGLAARGVEPLVLDRVAQGANTSRAAVVHARTLELLATLTTDDALRDALRRYLDDLRRRPLAVSGDDLRAAGLPPGPRYRVLLDAVHAAVLNGTATDADAQRALLATLAGAEEREP